MAQLLTRIRADDNCESAHAYSGPFVWTYSLTPVSPASPVLMSQEKGQRSIRSFFSPISRPSPSVTGGGGDGAVSPNENDSQNAVRTPVSSQQKRRRGSYARAGIHVFDESPVSSRKQPDSADPPAAKRNRRTVNLCEDSDEEWLPDPVSESPVSDRKSVSKSASATSVIQTPTSTARRLTSTPISSSAASLDNSFASRTASTSFSGESVVPQSVGGQGDVTEWPPKDHKYRFLWPQNIRDADGKRPDDPDYDPATLRVPADFMRDLTAAQAQWWDIKSKHMDTVLFFKVGKFYELFNMDSLIGIEELNLSPMGGDRLHTGFPEKSIQKYTDILRERGYRIARVEQTESNTAREERVRTGVREKNVVNREVCQITTPGTSREVHVESDAPKYLMSLCQVVRDQEQAGSSERFLFGVCFTDTTVGRFQIGQFTDDRSCSRLRSLLAHHPPAELLIERRGLNSDASNVISMWLPSAVVRPLIRDKQFLSAEQTLKLLQERRYFESALPGDDPAYPDVLKQMLDPADALMQTPLPQFSLAVKALGGMVWYLRQCLIDEELLTIRQFEKFIPADEEGVEIDGPGGSRRTHLPTSLILDSLTLNHLDIFDSDFGIATSLFGLLNYTETKFGQRMLRFWISSPLTSIVAINDRLDAIDDLSSQKMLMERDALFSFLHNMPDLDRLLNFVHTQGIQRKNDHPDSRAQLFEDYDKKKIHSLSDLINSFFVTLTALKRIQPLAAHFKSSLLKSLVTMQSAGGQFPDMEQALNDFVRRNDLNAAKNTGKVRPDAREGSAYADVIRKIAEIEERMQNVLDRETRTFGAKLKFTHSGKKRYLIEVPAKVFEKVNPSGRYTCEQRKKNSYLLYVPEVVNLLPQLKKLEEERETMDSEAQRLMFAQFASSFEQWSRAVQCIATLDALLSLSKARSSLQSQFITMTRPEFVPCSESEAPVLEIREGKHPILAKLNPTFVSNDLSISDKLMIVTGPNMGGKSTLMRQTGLIVIMAQIGSFVPAASVRMTPVDRVFTRLGAMDRIAEGESTFFVELSETSTILRHATRFSLVLLDELGRGTSTHDGTAVAYAVVHALSQQKRCRTLFSTHYHSLSQSFVGSDRVSACHMSCHIPGEAEAGAVEQVTFLYRVAAGNCPKSYGFNVARKAGLPESVILQAQEAAARLQQRMDKQMTLTQLMKQLKLSHEAGAGVTGLRDIVIQMKEIALSAAG